VKSTPIQTLGSQFLQEDTVGNSVKKPVSSERRGEERRGEERRGEEFTWKGPTMIESEVLLVSYGMDNQ